MSTTPQITSAKDRILLTLLFLVTENPNTKVDIRLTELVGIRQALNKEDDCSPPVSGHDMNVALLQLEQASLIRIDLVRRCVYPTRQGLEVGRTLVRLAQVREDRRRSQSRLN